MKWLRVLSMIAILGVSASAVAEEKKKREEISQADGERLLAFFGKFVDAIVKNKDNCSNMAKDVTAVIDANADAVKLANDAKSADKKLPKALEEKMMARVKELMPAMQKCGGDKDVKEAIKKLDKKAEPPKAAGK
jgi:hypothetical protein